MGIVPPDAADDETVGELVENLYELKKKAEGPDSCRVRD
jgi:hypothetical protein